MLRGEGGVFLVEMAGLDGEPDEADHDIAGVDGIFGDLGIGEDLLHGLELEGMRDRDKRHCECWLWCGC